MKILTVLTWRFKVNKIYIIYCWEHSNEAVTTIAVRRQLTYPLVMWQTWLLFLS